MRITHKLIFVFFFISLIQRVSAQGRLQVNVSSRADSSVSMMRSLLVDVDLGPIIDSIDIQANYKFTFFVTVNTDCILDSSCAMDSFYFRKQIADNTLNLTAHPKVQALIISSLRNIPIQFTPELPTDRPDYLKIIHIPVIIEVH